MFIGGFWFKKGLNKLKKDLIASIKQLYPGFSKGQKLISDYIVTNYEKAAFMTAAKLGKEVNVSESTVVRFATELGFDGYPKLQKAMQEEIRTRLTSVQRMKIISDKMSDKDILKTVLMSDIDKLTKTLSEIREEDFLGAVDTILNSSKIYILGARSCYSLANFLEFYLNHICDNVKKVSTTSASETFEQMYRVSKDDVVIGISYPRYSKRTINALKFASDRGAKIVAITDSNLSPIAEHATYVLTARNDMSTFVDSLVAPLSVINALIVALVMKRKDEVARNYEELEDIWDEYDVYEKNSDE